MTGDPQMVIRFPMSCGCMIRNRVTFQLKTQAEANGLECKIDEDKRWLASDFFVTITGPQSRIEPFEIALKRWFRELEKA